MANATSDTDALNRLTADNRYYSNTTTLDAFELPVASVSLNSQKLINVAPGTALTDCLTVADDMRYQWLVASVSTDLVSGFSNTQTLVFATKLQPATNGNSRFVTYDTTTGIISLATGHVYNLSVQTEVSYINATNTAVTINLVDNDLSSTLKTYITTRAPALAMKQLTNFTT